MTKKYEVFAIRMKDADKAREALAHARKHYNPKGLILWQSLESFTNNDEKGVEFIEYFVWEDQATLEAGAEEFTTSEHTQPYLMQIDEMLTGRWLKETGLSGGSVDGFNKL